MPFPPLSAKSLQQKWDLLSEEKLEYLISYWIHGVVGKKDAVNYIPQDEHYTVFLMLWNNLSTDVKTKFLKHFHNESEILHKISGKSFNLMSFWNEIWNYSIKR